MSWTTSISSVLELLTMMVMNSVLLEKLRKKRMEKMRKRKRRMRRRKVKECRKRMKGKKMKKTKKDPTIKPWSKVIQPHCRENRDKYRQPIVKRIKSNQRFESNDCVCSFNFFPSFLLATSY